MFTVTTNQRYDELVTFDVDADVFYQSESLIVFEKAPEAQAESRPTPPYPSPYPTGSWAAPVPIPAENRRVAGFPIAAVVAITETKEG